MNHSRRTRRGILQIGNKNIFIYEGINIVGRSKHAVVILKDLVASQQHAIFTIINDAHYISDVNSTNGTKLNGTNLSPFQMYLLEEGSEIEFTPQFIGKYKKIHDKNSSQIYTPQYESQNTQREEGFYEASTQVEMVDKTKAMFSDDMDDDLSKMVIDTQMINDSMIGKNKPAAPEESIDEAETQLMVTVPSINEAPAQVVTKRCSVVSAIVDSQFFAGNTQHVEIAMEPSGDKLDLNGGAPNSIDEESTNIPINEIGLETSTTLPSLPLTNVPENEITEEIVKAESAKILPESDDEGVVKQKGRSSVRRSRFIISDSEDSAGEEVETKIPEPKTIENSVISDCEDSFITRKSIGNASLDYIPATQDASFSRTSDQELCESGDISALQISTTEKDESVINDSDTESVDFIAPTQPICKRTRSSVGLNSSDLIPATQDVCDDVDFDSPTQPLDAAALCTEQEKDDIDFEAPTQPIIQPVKTVPVPHVEEETDFESPTQPIMRNDNDIVINEPHPVMKRVQEIESQLEVWFETQNVTLSTADGSRPTNPLASLIETCSTQDVISSLTGGGTKRSSDEFDVNGRSKRLKTSATPKANSTSKLKSIDTPEVDNSRKSSIKEIDVTNVDANRNKSILDFFGKASSTMIDSTINGKVSSKLSMIKKHIATDVLDESEHSVSNVEVECLADTIPMVAMDNTDISKHSQIVVDQTLTGDKTLDTTAARKKKRKFLDEETMCSMPTPEPVKTIDLTDGDKNKIESEEAPKACIKKTKTTAKANTTKRNTRQTRGSVRFEESSDDSDEECKVVTKKTRGRPPTNVRASTRAKKSVNYKEKDNSSDSEKEDKRIIITVPEKQIKLVITDEEDFKKKDIKSNIKKVSRSSKIKGEVTMSPERGKRVTKPKVIFTRLDDPKLKQIVRSLGGSIVKKIAQSTVLVTKKVQCSLKLLSAIGRSIPICSPEWLMECKKAHAFLDPWDYLIKDPDAEKMWKFKIGHTLEMSKRSKIFAGIQFLLVTTLSADLIKGGIEANGGKVVTRKPANDNFIVVGDAAHQSKYATYLKSKVKVVSAEAILAGILRQEIAFDEFALS
ncbi:mediator of DNA damage checkpoint protein 1-like [Atheta coriaria]|uniref:mediator of DNA damage checkpoint protein 1-like n=1 Tax=Dalotia coriaria TaxID=877792 RepID=UPI0031F3A17E